MLIFHKGHTDTIQVYSVTVMTHVKALQAGHSSQGHLSLLHRLGNNPPGPGGPVRIDRHILNSRELVLTQRETCTTD